jgi:putative flippase GtrA
LPRELLERLLALAGERYDYEMNMLLNLDKWGIVTREVPIAAAYTDGNKNSHFHPFRDSWRIYRRIAAFIASSLLSTLADWGVFALLGLALHWAPWMSYVIARAGSSFLNYKLNRHIVFGAGGKGSIFKYYGLAVCIAAAGSAGVELLSGFGLHELAAKLLVDTPLFLVSYTVQRKYIFNDKK